MTDQQQQQAPQPPTQPFITNGTITQPLVTFATTAPEPQPVQQQPKPQPEPVQVSQPLQDSALQSIIEQQKAQINALIAQNNNLNAQVTQMVQNGAQFGQPQQVQQMQQPQQFQQAQPAQFPNVYQQADMQAHPLSKFNPASLANDEDYSLEALAKEIGKRENNG